MPCRWLGCAGHVRMNPDAQGVCSLDAAERNPGWRLGARSFYDALSAYFTYSWILSGHSAVALFEYGFFT